MRNITARAGLKAWHFRQYRSLSHFAAVPASVCAASSSGSGRVFGNSAGVAQHAAHLTDEAWVEGHRVEQPVQPCPAGLLHEEHRAATGDEWSEEQLGRGGIAEDVEDGPNSRAHEPFRGGTKPLPVDCTRAKKGLRTARRVGGGPPLRCH